MVDIDLDWLRQRCLVVDVGQYWVFFGTVIATPNHALVVKSNDHRESCYYCSFDTQHRLVHPVRVGRQVAVADVTACCENCYCAVGKLPFGTDYRTFVDVALAAREQRLWKSGETANKRDLVLYLAWKRAERFPKLVDEALAQFGPPPEPESTDAVVASIEQLLGKTKRVGPSP